MCLWAAAQAKGYERGEWGTYQRWQERGAQVRKGEKATLVVFWKFANNAAETDDGETPKSGSRLLFTRGYSVFNAAQVDGYTPKADAETPIEQRIESADQFFMTHSPSGGLPIIVVQHPAQPLAAPDRSTITTMGFIRDDQPVAETLVVSLAMIMRDEFVNPFAQRALAEEDHAL